jgi:hypothetical protein
MIGRWPKKLISIPGDVDPRTRKHEGGKDSCEHHYVELADRWRRREWVCLNCDRLCAFLKWDATKGANG